MQMANVSAKNSTTTENSAKNITKLSEIYTKSSTMNQKQYKK